ncbi:MAG: YHS domain-containing protein, partial [Methylocapsa sp.]|nr:YHS domain-containing protein [Methylocapsa sp.]
MHEHEHYQHLHNVASGDRGAALIKDPVCGMSVDPAHTKESAEFCGQTYYFCCEGCKQEFLSDPGRYKGAVQKSQENGAAQGAIERHHRHEAADSQPEIAKDPVCGMSVGRSRAEHSAGHRGETYYFCSQGCKEKFLADPGRYVAAKKGAPEGPGAKAIEGAVYTCPMHPEIRQTGPGACPICGMALEPEMAGPEVKPNPELAYMTRRFWIALVLALPVVTLEMGGHLFNLHGLMGQKASNWVQFLFATPVVLWAGWPFFERGAKSLISRNLNMFTLIAMGTGVAWSYSAIATLAPGLFPAAFRSADGSVAIYFEAAAVITVLVLLGQILELRAREKTSGAIKALVNLAPRTARRIRDDGTDEEVGLDAIVPGDRLRIRPGEKVPVDGTILEG